MIEDGVPTIKTLIGEDESSCSVDPCLRSDWTQFVVHTTANFDKVKYLALILLNVSLASVKKHLAEVLCSIFFTHSHSGEHLQQLHLDHDL